MDAISGVVILGVGALAAVAALEFLGSTDARLRRALAITLLVAFIGLADVLYIAQLPYLAGGNLVIGVIIAGLLIFAGAEQAPREDDQGRDTWGR